MDALTTAAASGLQARMDSLDMLANNLANTASNGFKVDREFYGTYLAPEMKPTPSWANRLLYSATGPISRKALW